MREGWIMRRYRGIAGCAAAALLALAMSCLSLGADAGQAAETQAEEVKVAEAAQTPAGASPTGVRPLVRASDYVKIEDDGYKKMKIRIYPPADTSAEAQTDYKTRLDTEIMTRLYNLYPVESYPQDLENYLIQSLSGSYQQYAGMYGMDLGAFLSTYLGVDQETFGSKVREAARKTLKMELLLRAVAEKEDIAVSDADLQKGLTDYAARYGYASADDLLADFDQETVKASLLMDKTLDFLEKVNQIEQIVETESAQTETEAADPSTDAGQES